MTLYHGSNLIVEKPRLLTSARTLDFGAGFYTTANKEQAVDFSAKVVARAKKINLADVGTRTVSMYDFDEEKAFKSLNILKFTKPDERWLDYVFRNRRGGYSGKRYDIVIGAVANDDVYPTLLAYEFGALSAAQTIDALKVKTLYDQYVFASEKSFRFLRFAGKILPEETDGQ